MVTSYEISKINISSNVYYFLNICGVLFGTILMGFLQLILCMNNQLCDVTFHYWDLCMDKCERKRVILDRDNKDTYIIRYYLLHKDRLESSYFNIFLHKIVKSDDDDSLHDHPWSFFSIILSGGYYESLFKRGETTNNIIGETLTWRPVGYYSKNKATYCHKISLKNNTPCWTLFFAFKQTRPWGFWKKDGENNYTWIESSEYFKID